MSNETGINNDYNLFIQDIKMHEEDMKMWNKEKRDHISKFYDNGGKINIDLFLINANKVVLEYSKDELFNNLNIEETTILLKKGFSLYVLYFYITPDQRKIIKQSFHIYEFVSRFFKLVYYGEPDKIINIKQCKLEKDLLFIEKIEKTYEKYFENLHLLKVDENKQGTADNIISVLE